VLGLVLFVSRPAVALAFAPDPQVRAGIVAALAVAALTQPLAGWVFVLDGVLIGAGDGRYLALAGLVTLAAYLPLVGLVLVLAPAGTTGLVALWAAFAGGFMAVRAVTLGLRARGGAWLVLGA
jgi:Na+-driven multidrug efflux pump